MNCGRKKSLVAMSSASSVCTQLPPNSFFGKMWQIIVIHRFDECLECNSYSRNELSALWRAIANPWICKLQHLWVQISIYMHRRAVHSTINFACLSSFVLGLHCCSEIKQWLTEIVITCFIFHQLIPPYDWNHHIYEVVPDTFQ